MPVVVAVLGLSVAGATFDQPPATAQAATPRPLGTLSLAAGQDPSCPVGHECSAFQVTCPGVQAAATGFLASAPAAGPVRGLVVFFSGLLGQSWWSGRSSSFLDDLRARGFQVVQVRWPDGWPTASPGERVGPAVLACRPATVVQWVHQNWYVPLGVTPGAVGRCGFCITGNSGGASQSSYALAHFGLDTILDAVIPTSGPPHAALARGCIHNAGEEGYHYGPDNATVIDTSYGFTTGGPCELHDATWVPRWNEDSVDTGGVDFFHPTTRVHVILGGQDRGSAPAHGRDYTARLQSAGTPYFTLQEIPAMGHQIRDSTEGLSALTAAITATTTTAPVTTTSAPATKPPVSTTTTAPRPPAASPPTSVAPSRSGYWMVGADGAVYAFGDAPHYGNAPVGRVPAVDIEPTGTGNGYWVVDNLGRVFAFGDASYLGNAPPMGANESVTSISAGRSGGGYWLFTTRGRVIAFGDAPWLGDMSHVRLNGPVLDSVPTPTGRGYYMVASDGGIFTFGDAGFHGSMGSVPLNAPVQSLVPDVDGTGYWLVASDGGIFSFEVEFFGSMGDVRLNKPVTGMVGFRRGYLMVAEDGGIFAFGEARFAGSLGGNPPANPVTAVASLA